jgi:uncharacterized protein
MRLPAVLARFKVARFPSCVCFFLIGGPALAQTQPTTTEIKTLLHLNGSVAIISQLGPEMAEQVIAAMRKANPALPPRADAVVSSTVETYIRQQAAHEAITNFLVPIYGEYLSKNDVEQLIRFYRTPVGRKLARVTPAISFESTRAGQQWAESIAPGLQAQLVAALKNAGLAQ